MIRKGTIVLLYGLEVCNINASDIASWEYPVMGAFMKIFNTKSTEVVRECQSAFGFRTVREQILLHKINFLRSFVNSGNAICSIVCESQASAELASLQDQLDRQLALQ